MVWVELGSIIGSFFIIVGVLIVRFIFRRKIKQAEDIDINGVLGFNLVPELTNGHAWILEQKIRKHISGALIIEGIPMDVKWKEDSPESNEPIKKVKLVVKKHQRIAYPTGEFSWFKISKTSFIFF